MSFNLIDAVKNIFNNDFSARASSVTGESENNIKAAMAGIIPSVLTGLLNQAGSGNPQNLLNMAKTASGSGFLSNLSGVFGNSSLLARGTEMLRGLFGDKLGAVSSQIANFSGIRESSATSLMSVVAPAAFGVLGNHAAESNMNAAGFLGFLNSQKDHILGALPSGLNLAGALGLGSLAGIGSKLSGKLNEFKGPVEKMAHEVIQKPKVKWLPLVLGSIAVLLILFFISKGCNGSDKSDSASVATDTAPSDTTTVVPATAARESVKVKLPNGIELDAYKGGIEDQLVSYLSDPAGKPGKDVWFDFDNLNFKTGSAEITNESMIQVQNISAILKAYPKVRIKIGGYTDRTGDSLANLKLSQNRADSVKAALKKDGANSAQIVGAEGYGSQFAKVPAEATDDERKKDRRISVSVRAK
jgi:outer membrane protein OmpA-like peptidoglycan-associated protein